MIPRAPRSSQDAGNQVFDLETARRLLPDAQVAACSHEHLHTPHPTGFLQHAAWAEEMLKTHDQQQCPGCGLWAVWVPKSP